jgi:pyrroloquinoline quinone biosynthesis protein D
MLRLYNVEYSVNAEALRYARGVRLRVESDDAAYLLVPEGVLDLNPSARAVLELVDGKRNVDDIAALLALRYDAPVEELRGDVEALCANLRDRGFLR